MILLATLTLIAAAPDEAPPRAKLEQEMARVDEGRASGAWFVPAGLLTGLGVAGLSAGLASGIHLNFTIGFGPAGGSSGFAPWGNAAIGFGVLGVALGVGAMIGLAVQRAGPNRRLQELERDLAAIDAEAEQRRDPGSVMRIQTLQRERPGNGLPTVLLLGGTGLAVAGIAQHALWNPNYRNVGSFVMAIVMGVVGAGIDGIGIWQLVSRRSRQHEIDLELERLRGSETAPEAPAAAPPIESRLPAAPVLFAYGWSF